MPDSERPHACEPSDVITRRDTMDSGSLIPSCIPRLRAFEMSRIEESGLAAGTVVAAWLKALYSVAPSGE